jgi:hypothetical protein
MGEMVLYAPIAIVDQSEPFPVVPALTLTSSKSSPRLREWVQAKPSPVSVLRTDWLRGGAPSASSRKHRKRFAQQCFDGWRS